MANTSNSPASICVAGCGHWGKNLVRNFHALDALQCIEAIRLYAAAHAGKLPARLEDITEAPAPLDPATGHPFIYEVVGDSATLSAPLPPGGHNHPSHAIRYVLKLTH